MSQNKQNEKQSISNEPSLAELYVAYENEFGSERAQGFLDAMKLFTSTIDKMFTIEEPSGQFYESTPNQVRTKLRNFHEQAAASVQKIENTISSSTQHSETATYSTIRINP